MNRKILSSLFSALALTSMVVAQEAGMKGVVSPKSEKFVNLPGLPDCMTASVLRGDPQKGPSTLLLKFTPGCAVPWHWHTAGETLVLASGTGEAQMKDGHPMTMRPGEYLYLPAKGIHRFTATSAVYLYDMPDAAFDIHYVDADGKEIAPEKALMPQKRSNAAAKSTH